MHFNYQKQLVAVWEKSVKLYKSGHTNPESFPIEDEYPFLASIGMNKMDVFDYVEDWICENNPDLATFILIHDLRRDFFIEEQNSVLSSVRLDSKTLPGKQEDIEGIIWLPRVMMKARSKLRGELPPETMFCCGGDRAFFPKNDIHPAEFLRIVKNAGEDDQQIIQWVQKELSPNK